VTRFDDSSAIRDKALQDVLHRRNPSRAEEGIREVFAQEQFWRTLAEQSGLDSKTLQMLATSATREVALKHADDPRFAELWRDLFEPTYGPIRAVA
jgi:hypothetical protein